MSSATSDCGLQEPGRDYADFEWQGGYADFSVSQSKLESVEKYIAGQEEHHRKVGFQDELACGQGHDRQLLTRQLAARLATVVQAHSDEWFVFQPAWIQRDVASRT